MKRRIGYFLVALLFLLILILNYPFINKVVFDFFDSSQTGVVERVIDGDTFVIEGRDDSVRLLGINSPESGEFYYDEARDFLERMVLNETVVLKFSRDQYDKYGRLLAYVYVNGVNVNVEIVKEGLANYYFYDGRDKYSEDLEKAWDICLEKEINLCQVSESVCKECITIESGSIKNSCSFSCEITGWTIKGEGREVFEFDAVTELPPNQEAEFILDLSDSGGSLYLRDGDGLLVMFKV